MHPLVRLAIDAISAHISNGITINPPEKLTPDMQEKAGVFVSMKKDGQLRGCIGTFEPLTGSVAEEVIRNAIGAATQDPRFDPVTEEELDTLTYSVDVLSEPERVYDKSSLDPVRYGVLVTKGRLKGLLLPDLEGVETVDEQLRITKMKAGIQPYDEECDIFRFEVRRYR